jgi:hypothetical protein
MNRLNCITCDQCQVVISDGPLSRRSKTGKTLHFCTQQCFDASPKPKQRQPRPKKDKLFQHLITPDQAAAFIDESNRIEEIVIPRIEALTGWMSGKSKHPEIQGQVKALQYVFDKYAALPLSVDVVCALHTRLMDHLLQPYELGLRREWVQIGGKLCPAPTAIRYMLERWCEKVNALQNPTESDVWNCHLAYEKIHPFIDGNGRSGRLLWLWLRYKHGFNYGIVMNDTKYQLYYPQFDPFNFDAWLLA